jgi:membrane associated rhomboid family serine protease
MASTTMLIGVLMIVLGVVGYVGTGMASLTALIPAVFGVLFAVLGAIARRDTARKHAMHAVAVLSLLGFLATVRSFAALPDALSGVPTPRGPGAVYSQAAFAVLAGILLALCVKSFIEARRARKI